MLNGHAIRYDKNGTILKEGIWKDDKFQYTQKRPILNSNSKLDKYKRFCESIGFVPGTEKFAECVVEAMKKDQILICLECVFSNKDRQFLVSLVDGF